MILPESFSQRVREQLGEEGFEAYCRAMDLPYAQGIRVNTRKTDAESLAALLKEEYGQEVMEGQIPWCSCGYYLTEEHPALSHSPYYYAGLYYLQEPSAMAPAQILPIEEGDRVLDLCAAPGGKTTALGARMKQSGLLIANDISPSRAQALLKNVELFGLDRTIVMNESPHRLRKQFRGFFQKIMLDAPCSGEGMFRKEPVVAQNWEQYGSRYYADIQKEVLEHAAEMLAPGGMMLYSTCTYSPEEDEQMLDSFLTAHPEFSILPFPMQEGMMAGKPEWCSSKRPELKMTAHFWPHLLRGEGHYAALLQKNGSAEELADQADDHFQVSSRRENIRTASRSKTDRGNRKKPENASSEKASMAALKNWAEEALCVPLEQAVPEGSRIDYASERIYAMLVERELLAGLKVLRPGLLLGSVEHERFEPSAAWAMAVLPQHVRHRILLNREQALHYLKGENVEGDFEDGWNLVCIRGEKNGMQQDETPFEAFYPLGWGKVKNGVCKNKYLKSWRMLR